MTILTVCQEVAPIIALAVPSVVFIGTNRELIELQSLSNEMIARIAKAYTWESLTLLNTYTGDGVTTVFNLPSDFDWMHKSAQIWSSVIQAPMEKVESTNDWLAFDTLNVTLVTNRWIKTGGQIHIKPAMAIGATAQFYYQSNLIVSPNSGSNKTAFTVDTDSFRLSERLLRLSMIWQWKANKGQRYAEDMETYSDALGELVGEDKGPGIIKVGNARFPSNVGNPYPLSITA